MGWGPGVSNLWLQLRSATWSRLQAGGEHAGFHFGVSGSKSQQDWMYFTEQLLLEKSHV